VELGFHGSDQGLLEAVDEVARHVDCSVSESVRKKKKNRLLHWRLIHASPSAF
jgi:hypothetical protein